MHAMQITVATTLGSTPGALAFAWDMFLNVLLITDWQAIARTQEHHVNKNLRRANRKRRQFDYPLGQQVLKKVHDPTKLKVRTKGPYTIECVHVNGNLTILLHEGITECINICRVLPYHWTIPHTPVKTILSMDCIEDFTFYLWSFISTSHLSELYVESFWVQFLFVHLWQSKSCHGGEECCAHGNNFYGYGGPVPKIWYLKISKVYIFKSI